MHRRLVNAAIVAMLGLGVAVTVPTLANGNSRDIAGSGATAAAADTPLVARLEQTQADPQFAGGPASGAVAVTVDTASGEVCSDAIAENSPTIFLNGGIGLAPPGSTDTRLLVSLPLAGMPNPAGSACVTVDPSLAVQLAATPADYFVLFQHHGLEIRGQLSRGPAPSGPAHLLPTPLRAYDSRDGDGPLPAGATRVVSLLLGKDGGGSTQIAVPPGATGAIVTLTVTDSVDGGYLKLYAGSGDEPATSSINWSSSGQNVAVTASVAVDSTSRVKVTGGVNPTDVVIDVVGYYF